MLCASIYLAGRQWVWPAAALLAVALLLVVWGYRHAPARGGLRWACALLKFTGFVALAVCLLEPLWSGQRAKPGANFFAVVADNSQGLQIRDRGQATARGDQIKALLKQQPEDWQTQLADQFQLRRYRFDSRLQPTRDFSDLDFSGRLSALATSLRTIAVRYEGQPLAGVLLFTDGNATDVTAEGLDTAGLPPIYPVIIGAGDPAHDLSIQSVAVSQTAFEDAPVILHAEVAATGYAGREISLRLRALSASGDEGEGTREGEEQTREVRGDGETLAFRFQFRPEASGVSVYELRTAVTGAGLEEEEATLANNRRVVVVDRGRGPHRILYVAGRPNWEYKFLNRALSEDDQVQLVGLIRVARREPKFEFKSRQGETSNPLYRGFGDQGEGTEQYDEPVLIRLNTRDELELQGGFPKTEEELFEYKAVILDDIEAAFFTRDQLTMLTRYVSERGGGLLMLGGPDSFRSGAYERTPMESMLPVYLDAPELDYSPRELKLALTREGWLQPWVRLRSTEGEERARIDSMPGFLSLNRAEHIKPGAIVPAQVTDSRGKNWPALAVQRYGHGRTAALMIGDLWQWGMKDASQQSDLGKAWRQLARWLVADVPPRTSLLADADPSDPNQAVRLQVRVREKNYQPLDNATVTIEVRPLQGKEDLAPAGANSETDAAVEPGPEAVGSGTNAVRLNAEASGVEPGLYEATYVPRITGGYYASATATDPAGMEVGRAETGWTSDPAAEEFESLKPNRAMAELLARQTGGEVVTTDGLEAFVGTLAARGAPVQETWTRPLWHQALVFLFALACFVAEWGLRRWHGLA